MATKWIVQRVEEHGELTRTEEIASEAEANTLYANWCNNISRFNDQTISLLTVNRTETLVAQHVNLKFKTVQ